MAVVALMMVAALVAPEPDGVVATAPATAVDLSATARPLAPSLEGATQDAVPHGLTTDQQVDRWIAARSTAETPWGEATGGPDDERRMHGEVSFGIGTGGYRDYGAAVSVPLGENGRLHLSYRQVENGYGYGGYEYGRAYEPLSFDGGEAFPGDQPDAAVGFKSRMLRPGGPSRRYPLIQPDRSSDD